MKLRTLIVLAMLVAPSALWFAPGATSEGAQSDGIEGAQEADDGPSSEGPASGRFAGDAIEWINPLPTASAFYGSAWKDGADGAILVGQAGTVVKYRPFSSPKFSVFPPAVSDRLNAVAYRPGSSTAVIVGDAGTILVFDGSAFTPIGSGTRARLSDIAWKGDGSAAVIVGDNGTVLVFDGTAAARIPAPDHSNMTACAWAPSLDYAVAVGQRGAAYKVNLTAVTNLTSNVSEDLLDIAYKPGGAQATAVGTDGKVVTFDGQSFQNVSGEAGRSMMAIAWRPDATVAIITGFDNNGHASSIQTLEQSTLTTIPCNLTSSLKTVLWEPGTEIALISGTRGLVAEYTAGTVARLSSGTTNEMDAAAWRSDGSMALVVGLSGYLARFDGSSLAFIDSGTQEDLKDAAWKPGDEYALVCGRNGEVIRFWGQNSTAERLSTGLLVNVNYTSVSWKPDGSYALLAGDGGKLVKFDGSGFTLQQVIPYPVDYLDVAWRPDGVFALIGGVSGNLLHYEEKLIVPYFCVTKVAVGGAPPGAGYFSISWRTWQGLQEAMVAGTSGVVVLLNDSGTFLLNTESSMNFYYSISCLPGSGYAIAAGTSGRLLAFTGNALYRPLLGTDTTLLEVSWRPDGAYALVLGQSGVALKYIMAKPTGPQAVISWPRTGTVLEPGTSILFDGSNSTPTFGDSLSFIWLSNISGAIGSGPKFSRVLEPGNHLVTLWANDTQLRSSKATVAVTVRAPNRAPVARIDSPVEGRTYNNTDLIEFDASRSYDPDGDPVRFWWTSSHDGPLGGSAAFNGTLNIGAHAITVWVADGQGYNVSRTVNITVVMFNNPPVAVISSPVSMPGQPYTTKDMVLFDCRMSRDDDGDSLSYYWTSNLSGYIGGTSRFSRALQAGIHRITLWADDSRGGNVSANITILVVKANEPPVLLVDTPVEGGRVSGVVQVTGSATDPEGSVAAVSVKIDDGDWQQAQGGQGWTYYLDTLNMSNGLHVIHVKATDGSAESDPIARNITVHNPMWGFSIAISFPYEGSILKDKVRILGTASRVGSTIIQVELRIDGGPWETVTGTSSWEYAWDTTREKNGVHTVTVRATDGTDSSPETAMTIRVDNAPKAGTPWLAIAAAVLVLAVAAVLAYLLLARKGGRPAPAVEVVKETPEKGPQGTDAEEPPGEPDEAPKGKSGEGMAGTSGKSSGGKPDQKPGEGSER